MTKKLVGAKTGELEMRQLYAKMTVFLVANVIQDSILRYFMRTVVQRTIPGAEFFVDDLFWTTMYVFFVFFFVSFSCSFFSRAYYDLWCTLIAHSVDIPASQWQLMLTVNCVYGIFVHDFCCQCSEKMYS